MNHLHFAGDAGEFSFVNFTQRKNVEPTLGHGDVLLIVRLQTNTSDLGLPQLEALMAL